MDQLRSAPRGTDRVIPYDDAGQLKQVTYSDGRTPAISYGCDAAGQRKSMSDGSGHTSISADGGTLRLTA